MSGGRGDGGTGADSGGRGDGDGGLTPMDGLVGWYPMDQAPDDGVVLDATGRADGSCTVCPTATFGHLGGAYQFSGTGDEILIPDHEALHSASGTIALWVYLSDDQPNMIASKPFETETANSWLLYADADGSLLLETMTAFTETGAGAIAPDAWFHLAGTWSPGGDTLYVNGEALATAGSGTVFDGNQVVLGADHDHGGQIYPLYGLLDDVRIYDRALSLDEIAALAAR